MTVFLYAFMWSWNDLLYAHDDHHSAEKRTIGQGLLLSYLNETNSDWGGAMAASLLASLPVVIAFAFLQRHFVAGRHSRSREMTELAGVFPVLPTPFTASGAVDEPAFLRLADWALVLRGGRRRVSRHGERSRDALA